MIHELIIPSNNYFGVGALNQLGSHMVVRDIRSALIVTDQGIVRIGLARRVVGILNDVGIKTWTFDGLSGEPTLEAVNEVVALARSNNCQAIVGVGGGSANDLAKASGIVITNGGSLHDYVGLNRSVKPCLPLFLVNTTAGTGSELSRAFIITDTATGEKLVAKDDNALATVTINDPGVMTGLPASVTGASGMDALTHAIEAYVSARRHGLASKIAQAALELIVDNLPRAIAEPENLISREAMVSAQTLAGIALGSAGVGLAHAIAHPLGGLKKISHGKCVGFVVPYVMAWNSRAVGDEYARLSRRVLSQGINTSDDEAITALISCVYRLSQAAGTASLPDGIILVGEDVRRLAEATIEEPNFPNNPVQPTVEEVERIISAAVEERDPLCLLA